MAIPVTVIGGYLGAGKTTCLNRLLQADHGIRIAVLVNDFGAVNIDAGLIDNRDGDTIALSNGCVCCSIADDLGRTLDRLVGAEVPPDQIVIEASGVADPAKIARHGMGWPGLNLDAVITLADAETVRNRAADKFVGPLIVQQLKSADIVLLNKTDLLSAPARRAVSAWAGAVAPGARLVPTRFGAVPPELLLGRSGPGSAPISAPMAEDAARHFVSWHWQSDAALAADRFRALVAALPTGILRAKGFVRFAGDDRRWVLQTVGPRWTLSDGGPWQRIAATDLVFIALAGSADFTALAERLDNCVDCNMPRADDPASQGFDRQ